MKNYNLKEFKVQNLYEMMLPILKSAQPILSNALKCAGPIFFIGLQASSIQTALDINKQKSVGKLSPIPFLCLWTNSIIWTMYGILKGDLTVLVPNFSGSIAGLGCALTYQKFSNSNNVIPTIASMIITILCGFIAWNRNAVLLGSIGCILAIALSGSPLATIKTVIRDKSTDALPLTTSVITWLNCISWYLYGILLAKDIMIYGPNFVGLLLASIQLSLFTIYGLPKPSISNKDKVSAIF